MSFLHRHLPLLADLQRMDGATARADVAAGLTTAVMLVPQAMAYAMLAGLDPIVGLYASLLPLVVYAFLGSSKQLAVGPVAMDSLLVAAGVGALAAPGTPHYLALAIALSLLVGLVQVAMGLARLGALVRLVSHPVIAGFSSAAALVIATSQLGTVVGISLPRGQNVLATWQALVTHVGDVHLPTLGLAAAAVATLVALKRWAPRVPRFLLVVVGGTLAVQFLGLDAQGVAVVGKVPAGLPSLQLPSLTLDELQALLPTAFTIALVGFLEAYAVAKRIAARSDELDADRELRALGMANLGGAFTGAYPVTGGFSRTAVAAQAGARTGLSGLVTAATVGLTLLVLTPAFEFLPKAVLAAIILTAVLGLVDIAGARDLWRVSRPDLAMMAITFVATLTVGIQQGILIGVAASLLWFVRQVAVPHVAVLGRLPGTTTYRKIERNPSAEAPDGTLLLRVDAPLCFANTAFLHETLTTLLAEQDRPITRVVLDASGVGSIDATAAAALDDLSRDLEERGIQFRLAAVRGPVRDVLARTPLWSRVGPDLVAQTVHDAVDAVDHAA